MASCRWLMFAWASWQPQQGERERGMLSVCTHHSHSASAVGTCEVTTLWSTVRWAAPRSDLILLHSVRRHRQTPTRSVTGLPQRSPT